MHRRLIAFVAAACGLAYMAPSGAALPATPIRFTGLASAAAPSDTVIATDDSISGLYALHDIALYGRITRHGRQATTRPWMRVVHGHPGAVDGMPARVAPYSIGTDGAGRVVAVVGRLDRTRTRVRAWWLYDVARDAARRIAIPSSHGCTVVTVAVWRSRRAYVEQCAHPRIMLVERGHARRLLDVQDSAIGPVRLVLRGRSLAAMAGPGDESLWRVLDRGRLCPKVVAEIPEGYEMWAGIGRRRLTWVTAAYQFDGLRFTVTGVQEIGLSRRCDRHPVVGSAPASALPTGAVNAGTRDMGVAIDGHTLFYATDTAIHRLRLPDR